MSFCVQRDHIRQPLNNHTRLFYLLEFLSKVQNTASSLSGRHDPCGLGVGTDHSCYPGYAAKIGAFETLTQIPRDISIPLGIPVTLTWETSRGICIQRYPKHRDTQITLEFCTSSRTHCMRCVTIMGGTRSLSTSRVHHSCEAWVTAC